MDSPLVSHLFFHVHIGSGVCRGRGEISQYMSVNFLLPDKSSSSSATVCSPSLGYSDATTFCLDPHCSSLCVPLQLRLLQILRHLTAPRLLLWIDCPRRLCVARGGLWPLFLLFPGGWTRGQPGCLQQVATVSSFPDLGMANIKMCLQGALNGAF